MSPKSEEVYPLKNNLAKQTKQKTPYVIIE